MRLLKDSAIYFSLSLGQKGIGFLLLPVYTAYLSPSDYGIVGTVAALVGLLQMLYPLGGDASMARSFFPDDPVSEAGYRRTWGTLFIFLLLVGGICTLGLSFSSDWVLEPALKGISFFPYVCLGLISAWTGPIRTFYTTSLQVRQRAGEYLFIEGGFMLVRIVLMLILIVGFRLAAEGVLLSAAVAEGCFALVAVWRIRGDLWWGLDWTILRKSLRYSLPIVPHMLAGWSTTYLASLILNYLQGRVETGLYNLAATIASIETFLVAGFNQAFLPRVYEALASSEPEKIERLNRRTLAAVVGFAIGAVGLSLFSPEVLKFMTRPGYWAAATVVPLLALAGFFHGVYSLYGHLLYYYRGGTKFLPLASGAGGIVSVALMLFLIPRFSLNGAALAACCGVLTRLMVAAIICNSRYRTPWSQGRIGLLTAVATILILMPAWIPSFQGNEWELLIPKMLAAIAGVGLLGALLPTATRKELFSIVRSQLAKLWVTYFAHRP